MRLLSNGSRRGDGYSAAMMRQGAPFGQPGNHLMRHQRFVVLSFIAAGLLVGVSFQAGLVSGFGQFAVPDTRLGGLVNLSTAISVAAGVITIVALIRNPSAVSFTDEVVDELGKVTWPTRDETVRASTTVVVTTLFTAAVLGAYDYIWKQVADLFLFTAG